MHIPDGFLSLPVFAPLDLGAAAALWLAARSASRDIEDDAIPRVGVMGAFVFAAQMVNFPIAAGTSGHLVGAVLLTRLFGPHLASLLLAAVLIVQCLLFQDGGLLALGANIFNMAFVGCYGGHALMRVGARLFGGRHPRAVVALAAWAVTVLMAAAVAVQLSLSGVVPLRPALMAMVGVHALIGVGEAALTVAVLSLLWRLRPELRAGATA